MKKVSLESISKILGVSKTTISLVLNNKGDQSAISKSTQKKILEKVKELNYKPNQFARGLKLGKSNTIGLIVSDISNSFYGKIAREVEDLLNKFGYNLIICSSDEDAEKEESLIEMLQNRIVDGMIISSTLQEPSAFTKLNDYNVPFVLIDRFLPNFKANKVVINNIEGAYNATEYLINLGHKNIALLSVTPIYVSSINERILGYKKALSENNIEKSYIKEIVYDNINLSVKNTIEDILKNQPEITAIFTINNNVATASLQVLNTMNISIPNRMSLISFDDIDLFELTNPTITSIAQPINEICNKAVEILIEAINSKEENNDITEYTLSTKLNIRNSCISIL